MKVLIVGGVAGGASAAARLRRLNESAEIIIFEKSGYVSYANCGLPYFVGDIIKSQDALTLQTPESFRNRFNVDVRIKHEVIHIDPDAKRITVRNLSSQELYEETYDKLILSPGARPIRPNMTGIDLHDIYTLRNVEDAAALKEKAMNPSVIRAIVIGGGFIGLETAENLRHLDIDVTLVEKSPQVLAPLDEDMASFVHAKLKENGIRLLLKVGVSAFSREEETGALTVHLDNGMTLDADLVVLAIGVTPDTKLAQTAGLAMGPRNTIQVDEWMRTSDPDIYALGDAVMTTHKVSGERASIMLAGPANKQGRMVADHICGRSCKDYGTQGSFVVKVFDMTAAATGLNERAVKAMGIAYDRAILSPGGHAGYYPGTKAMTMKVLYELSTRRILGAQIVGFDGVDKRIDVIATAMQGGILADELHHLDLAYAPPYSSAKDPVIMAGYMIENQLDGLVQTFGMDQLLQLKDDERVSLVDVRTPGEFAAGHIEGFINIPVDELRQRMTDLPQDKPVYLMCQSALRSYLAARVLAQHGYTCYHFAGGYRYYKSVTEHSWHENASYGCGFPE